MEWIKFYTKKWLYGSGRVMTPEKRGVWADLLALAAETKFRDGTLRFEVGKPMPRSYIAAILQIEPDTLDACLAAFQADVNTEDGKPRIVIWDDGTIFLTNFAKYQSKPEKEIIKEISKVKHKSTAEALKDGMNVMNARDIRNEGKLDNIIDLLKNNQQKDEPNA